MKDKQSMSAWKDEDIKDTRVLQIFVLKEFMKSLGYTFQVFTSHPQHFLSNIWANKGRERVSISTAVKLYNCQGVAKGIFGKPNTKLGIWSFDDYTLAKAKASRILKHVKLQYNRQTKSIICQDHRIKFVEHSYSKLFLNSRYLGN